MDPITTGALISGASSLLGGILGRKSQKDANEQNTSLQREFAQNGISWRVEDAKRAGLHPLFALGGAGATYTPSVQPVMDGQDISRAAQAFGEIPIRQAQLESLKAATAKDYAIASAADAAAARDRQNPVAPVAESFPVALPGQSPNLQWTGPHIPEALPGNPSNLWPIKHGPNYLTGDVKPGFQRFNTSIAGEVILPAGSSMSEAVESMENPLIQAWIISENLKHYGPGAEAKLRALLGDKYKWWTNPGGALRDSVRSFGLARAAQGGN